MSSRQAWQRRAEARAAERAEDKRRTRAGLLPLRAAAELTQLRMPDGRTDFTADEWLAGAIAQAEAEFGAGSAEAAEMIAVAKTFAAAADPNSISG